MGVLVATALWGVASSHMTEWIAALATLGLGGLKALGSAMAQQGAAFGQRAAGILGAFHDWIQSNVLSILKWVGVPAGLAAVVAGGLAMLGEGLPALAAA